MVCLVLQKDPVTGVECPLNGKNLLEAGLGFVSRRSREKLIINGFGKIWNY
jgi:hypothetical protein